MSKEAMKLALEGAANYIDALGGDSRKYRQALAEQPAQQEPLFSDRVLEMAKSALARLLAAVREDWGPGPHECHRLLAQPQPIKQGWDVDTLLDKPEQPAQQEPVAKVCHDLDGHIGWNPNLRQLPDEGAALYTSPPTLSLAQRPHECSRSHPHENMNAMCELRTEIARLTNENARLKAMHQDDEINTYRMTLLCIRDGLQQGMSKSIQKLQAREINDVLGLPSFASYRTSLPAQRKPLTDANAQFNAAIDFAIEEGTGAAEFLRCWREGNTSEWPEFEAAHGIKENT